jgi:Tfp pilus assembly protein FimV
MSPRGNWTSRGISIAAVTAALLTGPVAAAADARDVEELRAEVRQLQADLQALRGAMTEMSEVEQRYAALAKAPARGPSAPEPRSAPPMAVSDADTGGREPSSSRVAAGGSDSSARKSKHRRHRQPSRSRAKAGRASAADR